jgi:hypothetical protein
LWRGIIKGKEKGKAEKEEEKRKEEKEGKEGKLNQPNILYPLHSKDTCFFC